MTLRSAIRSNIKMALSSVKSNKWRSFLTMLGIIIGVASVVTVVSIGEGIKHQVNGQISQLGSDLITVRPGELVQRGSNGSIDGVNIFQGSNSFGSLSQDDMNTVTQTKDVQQAVPLALVNGVVKIDGYGGSSPLVLGTTSDLPKLLSQSIAAGSFFEADTSAEPNVAIIGANVAEKLFKQRAPLGQHFEFLGQTFFVQGVFNRFDTPPLSLSTDFNDTIFIPYSTAQMLTKNNTQLYEVLAKPSDPNHLGAVVNDISQRLTDAHQGQQKFTVLRQDEGLAVTNSVLDLLTRLIAGIAAISLLVGGIGIMDVMLVSVAERMHEIGIRKALGATNRQILTQFLTEASVLSVLGGLIGVVVSLVVSFLISSLTSLTPVVTWQIVLLATAVSLVVGVLFGTAPALKAARKDPIDALRNN